MTGGTEIPIINEISNIESILAFKNSSKIFVSVNLIKVPGVQEKMHFRYKMKYSK